ncbi:MAG: NAD(P)-binding domain-containing protein [Deltaproteobacteria bacterium]|nr:NAD(P)-binding domain-containing protein [Deltaproteobacteria bacterium]
MKRLVVIGAGPVGLEAALYASARGFDVTVLERGQVGASLLRWGPTRLFSPFGMNVSDRVKALLGADAPAEDALLTGPELVARVLEPVAASLGERVRTGVEVVSIGRSRMTRRDRPGNPLRFERTFSLLVASAAGEETLEADIVLDCSGVGVPCWAGEGGRPAPGERAAASRVVHYLGDLEDKASEVAGRRVLVVGNGHSAANAVVWLADLAEANPTTRVTWAVRGLNRRPVQAVAQDPLPERAAIVDRANDLAEHPPAFLTVERRAHILGMRDGPDGVEVRFSGDRKATFDLVGAFTGYRPDHRLIRELAVAVSPVSEGTAPLYTALACVTDCLAVPKPSAEDLETGEPGYYLVGSKSYGRMASFLLKDGISQVETIVDRLAGGRR